MKHWFRVFQKRFTFFHLYSVWGVLAIGLTLILFFVQLYTIDQVNSIYIDGLTGKTIIGKSPSVELGYVGTFSLVFLGCYLIINTLLVLLYRAILFRKVFEIQQHGRKLVVILPKTWTQLYFFVKATVFFHDNSAGKEISNPELQITAVSQGESLQCDMASLPTGKYSITRIDYRVLDPLGIFSALFEKTHNQKVLLVDSHDAKEIIIDTQSVHLDSPDSQFMSEANESYFATREYRPGDQLKRVHWKNTAKTGKLTVRIPEERAVKHSEINVVINLYVPHFAEVDQTVSVGKFLDATLGSIKGLLKTSGNTVHVYINGGAAQVIKEINTYNADKVRASILEESVAQAQTPLAQFISAKEIRNPVIFAMSSDIPVVESRNVFLYKQSQDFTNSFKQWVDTVLHNRLGEHHAESMGDRFKRNNLAAFFKRTKYKRLVVQMCKKNESLIPTYWKII